MSFQRSYKRFKERVKEKGVKILLFRVPLMPRDIDIDAEVRKELNRAKLISTLKEVKNYLERSRTAILSVSETEDLLRQVVKRLSELSS